VVRVFLIFLMLIAIGGATAAVVTYLRNQHNAPVGVAGRAPGVAVPLEAVFVPIKREDDANEMRTYVFVLEVRPGSETLVERQQVALRNIFTRYLTALAARADSPGIPKDRLAKLETIENIEYVKAQLRAAANETLDPGARPAGREPADVVQEVLIRSMIANVT
jgi:hypothetical protein